MGAATFVNNKAQLAYAKLSAAVSMIPPPEIRMTAAIEKHCRAAITDAAIDFVNAAEETEWTVEDAPTAPTAVPEEKPVEPAAKSSR